MKAKGGWPIGIGYSLRIGDRYECCTQGKPTKTLLSMAAW